MFDQVFQVLTLDEHVECHVVHSLRSRALQLDTVLGEVVTGLLVRPLRYLVHGRDQRLQRNLPKAVRSEGLQRFLRSILHQDRGVYFHLLTADLLVLDQRQIQEG